MFQYPEYQLFEETVYKDIAFGPEQHGPGPGRRSTAGSGRPPRLVGLTEDQLEKSPFELSGGQKRRVAIAGVIAMEPKVLILDEPTAGLDPAGREDHSGPHPGLSPASGGTTVILVSHSMEEIACNVDRILVLRGQSCVYGRRPPPRYSPRADELEAVGLDVPQVTTDRPGPARAWA